ncbi:orexin receptor type 2-like isoform X2 [Oratosquilla oratoria]|uniref:orexin receptor type 2-like isoform X2 n=1 Tax=Oratosquilla oratoria TaxID=337810 RepID=UPI003F771A74
MNAIHTLAERSLRPTNGTQSLNGTISSCDNITGYVDEDVRLGCLSEEDYYLELEDYIFPTPFEWVFIVLNSVVFIVGLVGNFLVCCAVYRNHSMRTVTNIFIVNLAVADFCVLLICLPSTVTWDVTETWFFGNISCKLILYFQTVSVSVSVLTLTAISLDRWYAICRPLKFRSTTSRARTAIIIIWIISLLIDLPQTVYLQTKPHNYTREEFQSLYLTQCVNTVGFEGHMSQVLLRYFLLFVVPLIFMAVAYVQIVRVLWHQAIPGHRETTNSCSRRHETLTNGLNVATEGQIRSRRKAAKMLVAVVVMFGLCYLPVHAISIIRIAFEVPNLPITTGLSQMSHWLCYANSAVNPLIYNFMSGKFRREFYLTFGCRVWTTSAGDVSESVMVRSETMTIRHRRTNETLLLRDTSRASPSTYTAVSEIN